MLSLTNKIKRYLSTVKNSVPCREGWNSTSLKLLKGGYMAQNDSNHFVPFFLP